MGNSLSFRNLGIASGSGLACRDTLNSNCSFSVVAPNAVSKFRHSLRQRPGRSDTHPNRLHPTCQEPPPETTADALPNLLAVNHCKKPLHNLGFGREMVSTPERTKSEARSLWGMS